MSPLPPHAAGDVGPGLYVHVPFCETKCGYCDFYSVPDADAPGHRFADALEAEAALRVPAGFRPRTVFVGGGTPSVLAPDELRRVAGTVRALSADRGAVVEWTVENNPGSLTPQKAEILREAGVTRLSIGVQSFDDALLRSMGRVHDAGTARNAVRVARESGIPDVSLDLLFALPGQSTDRFRRDLDEAVALGTDHVSAYALIYEDGTPLTHARDRGQVVAADEDTELSMMRTALAVLGGAGLVRYEVSSFAREGKACLHNLNYWRNGDYIGLGPSAASHVDGERRTNVRSWKAWERRVFAGEDPVAFRERLDPSRAAGEEMMLRLRTIEGVDVAELAARWGVAAVSRFGPLLARYEQAALMVRADDGRRLVLTERGFEVADGLIADLMAA